MTTHVQPGRPCGQGKCHRLTPCPDHPARQAWRSTTKAPPARMRGSKLQKARTELFMREPLCRPCSQAGRVALATIRDHVIPLEEGGKDDDGNVQPICRGCHKVKTQAESQRGIVSRNWIDTP